MNVVEDELHFLMECPKYAESRSKFIDFVNHKEPSLLWGLGRDIRICFRAIMASQCKEIIRVVADFIWDAFAVREAVGVI